LTLLHDNTNITDIGRAVNDAIATKIYATANLTHIQTPVALIGGMANNAGFVAGLKKRIGADLLIPQKPEIACATGAALVAAAEAG
jgi:activator of 2-hydroxyglutaryl-CoA dehydratase